MKRSDLPRRRASDAGSRPPLLYRLPHLQSIIRRFTTSQRGYSKVDTPNLDVIPDDIVSNDDIDTAIGALTKHIKEGSCELRSQGSTRGRSGIRAKNAALLRASVYPTPEYRSRARAEPFITVSASIAFNRSIAGASLPSSDTSTLARRELKYSNDHRCRFSYNIRDGSTMYSRIVVLMVYLKSKTHQ
ncbi:hypothetical protein EVAR_66888_1 [Eumeta japonica]|uniref:Uncharacterized protein n=1 Tax=Eumeta variegata TaxID=151549 RepID=A0A4C1ZT84_EUMVA|nr:hypothetical protein EVAR_66888_1 [Eumeta japonica]